MDGMLDFHVIRDNFTYFMIGRYPNGPLGGLGLTVYLAEVSCILSFFGGLILWLLSVSRHAVIRYPAVLFINTVRGLPLLMVIFWMYFLLPAIMWTTVPESQTVIMGLTLFTSAYMSQIVRAGIDSIPKGQTEAALSTGLKYWQVMVFIVLPQG